MSSILRDVWELSRVNIARSIVIIIALSLAGALTLFKVLGIIILVNTLFDLLFNEPDLKRWLKSTAITAAFIGGLYYVYQIAGWFGVIGLASVSILVLLIMLGFILYSNWKVYDRVTTWGAERIKGKHKREFNLQEALNENERHRKR